MTQKLFTLGPVEMHGYTREGLKEPLPYFRTGEFSEVVLECAERLRCLAGAPPDAHVYLLTCSGTGAMEAVVAGCFGAEDRLIAVDGGGFGHRFVELATHHGIPCASAALRFGERLSLPVFDRAFAEEEDFTGLLVNLDETSTGQLYDRDLLASFCRDKGLFFICDAISAFLADSIDFAKDGMDALILSSQKALALPPGLSAVILSDRLYQKIIIQDIRPFSLYFNFRDAEANAIRGQTPFTPAVGTILLLRDRLAHLEAEGGAEASVARTKELAEDFRLRIAGLTETGRVKLPEYKLSNALTPLIFPDGNAQAVFRKLAYEHGVWLNPNGGLLEDILLRVGHLGALTKDDNAMLAGLLTEIL